MNEMALAILIMFGVPFLVTALITIIALKLFEREQ